MKYTIVMEKAPKNYAAYAPDLPDCVAAAKSRFRSSSWCGKVSPFFPRAVTTGGSRCRRLKATATEVEVASAVGP